MIELSEVSPSKITEIFHSSFIESLTKQPKISKFELMLPSQELDLCPPRGVFQQIFISSVLDETGKAKYLILLAADTQCDLAIQNLFFFENMLGLSRSRVASMGYKDRLSPVWTWDQSTGLPSGMPKIKQLLWFGAKLSPGCVYFGFSTVGRQT